MNAWLTARRVKRGQEEEFRTKWRGGDLPEGMIDAYLLEDEDDPRETLSVSLWDTADALLAYRTGEDGKKRKEELADIVDKERWSRSFVAWNAWDLTPAGGKKKLLLPVLLLAGIGAGVFYFLRSRKKQDADEWDTWEPEPATMHQPAVAPVTATAAPATAEMPPRPVSPMPASSSTTIVSAGMQSSTPQTVRMTVAPRAGGATSASMQGGSHGSRKVRDLMTANPETVEPNTDVASAAQRMRTLDVGVLPVLAEGRLSGVITDRDIAIGFAERDMDPSSVRVGDLMSDAPQTIGPDASADVAARMMAEHQIRRLPVVEGSRLVGILALGDLAADGAERAAAHALEGISEPASPDQ